MVDSTALTLWPKPAGHTRFLLIRHGETDWNQQRRFQGHTDIPLNQRGIEQAEALATRLKQLQVAIHPEPIFDTCYSSDLQRALHTAQHLTKWHSKPPTLDESLRERNYGVMAGLTGDEMASQFPALFPGVSQRIPDQPIPRGESLIEFNTRITDTFIDIADRHPEQTILLVAHGGVLDCIYRHCTGTALQPARSWLLPNTALNVVDRLPDRTYKVRLWGDLAHTDATDPRKNLDEVDGRVA